MDEFFETDENEGIAWRDMLITIVAILVTVIAAISLQIGAKNLQVIWMETPEGWKSDQHTRDVEEVLYILSGKCAITSENGRVEGTAGTIIFVPPGEKHQHENIGSQTFSQLVIFAPPMKR